jgi:hypothetical protein
MRIDIWHTVAQLSNLCARDKKDYTCNLMDFFFKFVEALLPVFNGVTEMYSARV